MVGHGRWTSVIALALPGLILAACQPAEEAEPVVSESEVPTPLEERMTVDTTAEALWAHLETEDYAENWEFWPGKEPFYEGGEPHGVLLSTYLNEPAAEGLPILMESDDGYALPIGSIVVKENYTPDSTLAAFTVMYKAEGYDGEHNGWFWMKRLANGTVEAEGRVGGCISCHEEAAERYDFLLTAMSQAEQEDK
jgi:hypothetical protein